MRVTLDTNCLIYLEGSGPEHAALAELRAWAQDGPYRICIPAISASERTQDGSYLQSFGEFASRLERIGLGDAELLRPMMYLDVCFSDHCLLSDEEMLALERKIHEILHPGVAFEYSAFCVATNGSYAGIRCCPHQRSP